MGRHFYREAWDYGRGRVSHVGKQFPDGGHHHHPYRHADPEQRQHDDHHVQRAVPLYGREPVAGHHHGGDRRL